MAIKASNAASLYQIMSALRSGILPCSRDCQIQPTPSLVAGICASAHCRPVSVCSPAKVGKIACKVWLHRIYCTPRSWPKTQRNLPQTHSARSTELPEETAELPSRTRIYDQRIQAQPPRPASKPRNPLHSGMVHWKAYFRDFY